MTNATRARLWAPVAAIVAALLLLFVCFVYPGDSSAILYPILVAPVFLLISLAALVWASFRRNRRHLRPLLSAIFAFWAISIPLFLYEYSHPLEIRGAVRWLVESRGLKREVLASGRGKPGELQSMDWDGWGMFAQNTEIYLVFDPTDSLAEAAKTHRSGRFTGIPCEVRAVRRLESHWYSVLFYTSQTWGDCH